MVGLQPKREDTVPECAPWIRVLIVDDSDAQVRGLVRLLAGFPDLAVVGRAATGTDGIALGRRLTPDAVVLDLSLPDMSGWRVATAFAEMSPRPRLVVMSDHESPSHRDAARELGAVFVHKQDAAHELVAALGGQPIVVRDDRATDAEPIGLDLGATASRMTSLLRRILPPGVLLRCQVAPGLPRIMAPVLAVEQIIADVIGVASERRTGGTAITVSIDPVDASRVCIPSYARATPRWVRLAVALTDEHTRPGDPLPTGRRDLAAAAGLLATDGGWLEVERRPDEVAEVRVYWPAVAPNRGLGTARG